MASILLRNVYKLYDDGTTAVEDISLRVDDHEFVIFVGPSGCGKTTVLRMIAGLEEVSRGEIYIGERDVTGLPPQERDIAMLFQSYALYPHMSVFDNMAFSLAMNGLARAEIRGRVEEAADILGIAHLLDRRPRALSGGQRQRVALGRAIVRRPSVFLFDEPLSNLDAKLRAQMRAEIVKIHERLGTTLVYVTHDQIEAMSMGTRLVVMRDGRVEQADTPENLLRRPRNLFVANYISAPQLGLLEARLEKRDGVPGALCAQGLFLPLPARHAAALEADMGREVIVGIRPDDLCVGDVNDGKAAVVLEAVVRGTQAADMKTYLRLDAAGASLLALCTGKPVPAGSRVVAALCADRIHLFDRESGRTLTDAAGD